MPKDSRFASTSLAIRTSRWFVVAALGAALFAIPAYAAEHAEEGKGSAVPSGPAYVCFNPIFIPIIDRNRVTQQVGITLMLQLVPGENQADVEAKRYQLTDAFFRDLYAFFQVRVGFRGGINQAYLKARLLKTASRVVGPNAVQEVLIEQFLTRPK